jgi:hypothetical protein
MKLRVTLASLLVASTAYAQAPGEVYEGDLAPPSMAPVAAVPVVGARVAPVRRWSVGVGFGSMELAPHVAPDATTEFDIAQLYVRYRPWRHLELELALGGGSEFDMEDGSYRAREVSTAVLAVRYRFSPQRRWNWWLMAGMGSLAVTREGASDAEREEAHQSTLQFGAGVERRWSRFALQFEARAVGVAPHETDEDMPVRGNVEIAPGGLMQPLPPSEPGRANDGMKGGQFVFSGNYYF